MKKPKRKKFIPRITKIKLNYEQTVLTYSKGGIGPLL